MEGQVKLERNAELGIAIFRIAVGIVFAAHGAQKLFTFGLGGVSQAFAQMGIPLATVAGPLVALVEFFGGLALIVGFGTRVAPLLLAGVMLGAIVFVHLRGGFFLPTGVEFAFTLLAANVGLTLAGPGALAIDNRIRQSSGLRENLSRAA